MFRDFRPLKIRAYAKINLDLRVLARRDDGYHELRTLLQTIALHDTLTFTRTRNPFELRVSGDAIPSDSRNLVWKAARSMWGAIGRRGEPEGLSVEIVKRIPVEAGLGGGSSDAAATLRALRRLWDAKISGRETFELATALGSDVPFFLLGGTALALGRGEILYPLPDLPPRHVVIAKPAEGVSTADAYRWVDERRAGGSSEYQRLEVSWPPGALAVCNDFELPVYEHLPQAGHLRNVLAESGADVAMLSGSGSAVFGLFSGSGAARRGASRAGELNASVWGTVFQPGRATGRV